MLIGHSGCKLRLLEGKKELIVRKISKSIEYNARLEAQCTKQSAYYHEILQTPQIFDAGYRDGLFFFDMEYIQGLQLSEYIKRIQIKDCKDLLKPFISFPLASPNTKSTLIFKEKLDHLESILPHAEIVDKALLLLHSVDWSRIPESQCHGDLTFENILVSKGKFYLIDFLDSFYNSWMLDAAKLLQDLEFRWSYQRNPIDENTNLRLLIIRKLFLEALEDPILIYHLLLLNMVRIIPYIQGDLDRHFIYSALGRML